MSPVTDACPAAVRRVNTDAEEKREGERERVNTDAEEKSKYRCLPSSCEKSTRLRLKWRRGRGGEEEGDRIDCQ